MRRQHPEPDDLSEKVECVATLAAAARIAAGQPDDTVRAEALAVAKKAICKFVGDEYERERYVAIVQRTIERKLAERRPRP